MSADDFHGICSLIGRAYQKTLSQRSFSDLFRIYSLLFNALQLAFLRLNFTITNYFFFKRWQACKSPGLTLCLVKENALQIFSLSFPSLIDGEVGFTSTDSRRWYWALVTAFLSDWTILSISNLLQFFVIATSDERISNLRIDSMKKSSNRFDKWESFDVMSSILISSSMSSSLERFSIDFLFEPCY